MTNYPVKCRANELRLADIVKLWQGVCGDALVIKITETHVILWRPYISNAPFSMGGGGNYGDEKYSSVIPYIGIEDKIIYQLDCDRVFDVWQRTELR